MKTTKTTLKAAYDTFHWTLRDITGGTTEENLRGADHNVTRLELHASEITELLKNPNKACREDTWLMERCAEVPAHLEAYRQRYVGKYEAWQAEQEAKRKTAGTHDNPVRYEHLSKSDPDYREKFKAQAEQFSADAKAGKVLCLSDLMISAGM